MGLFSKKVCSICGGESGFIMNQRLADGDVCKECRKNFSPFFTATSSMTLAYVKQHLAYREENKRELANFRPTYSVGRDKLLFIDSAQGKFALATDSELRNGTADIFNLSDFAGATFFIKESEHINREDHTKDYYYYEFYLVVSLNHQTIPEIEYRINSTYVRVDRTPVLPGQAERLYRGHGGVIITNGPLSGIEKRNLDKYMEYYSILQDMIDTLMSEAKKVPVGTQYVQNVVTPVTPPNAVNTAQGQVAGTMSSPKFCPNCGTPVNPGAKFCIECGMKF